jgi:cytidyltransferase-like protein
MNDKQLSLEQINSLKLDGKSISFVSGNFNINHPGHIRFLLFAAEQAEFLVVGIHDRNASIGHVLIMTNVQLL